MIFYLLFSIAFAQKSIDCGAGVCVPNFTPQLLLEKPQYSAIDIGNNADNNLTVSVPSNQAPRSVRLSVKNNTLTGRNLNLNLSAQRPIDNAGSTVIIGDIFDSLTINVNGNNGVDGKDSSQLCAERILAGNYGTPAKDAFELRRQQNPALSATRCDNIDINSLQTNTFSCDAGFNEVFGSNPAVNVERIKSRATCQANSSRHQCLRRKWTTNCGTFKRFATTNEDHRRSFVTPYGSWNAFEQARVGVYENFEEDLPAANFANLSTSAKQQFCANNPQKIPAMSNVLNQDCTYAVNKITKYVYIHRLNCSPGSGDPIKIYPNIFEGTAGIYSRDCWNCGSLTKGKDMTFFVGSYSLETFQGSYGGYSYSFLTNGYKIRGARADRPNDSTYPVGPYGPYIWSTPGATFFRDMEINTMNIWSLVGTPSAPSYTSPGYDYTNNQLLPGSEWQHYVADQGEQCLGANPSEQKWTNVGTVAKILTTYDDTGTSCANISHPEDPNNKLNWVFSGFAQEQSFGTETLTCTQSSCLVQMNSSETDKSIDTVNPTNGTNGTQQGHAIAIIYDAYNLTGTAQVGQPGRAGLNDISNNTTIRTCVRVRDANSEGLESQLAKAPTVTYRKYRWKPLNVTQAASSGQSASNSNNKIDVWKKVDSSVRHLLSKELL